MTVISSSDNDFKQVFEDLHWQDHVCLVYDDAKEWGRNLVRFVKAGLDRNHKSLCLMPSGMFSDASLLAQDEALLLQQAIKDGLLVHWHDFETLQQILEEGRLPGMFVPSGGSDENAGCRLICDMTWLKQCGVPEKSRRDFLLWMNTASQDHPLLVLSGYQRQESSSAELREAFGLHPYIGHAGQLLPGGFSGSTRPGRGNRFNRPVPEWRRFFRRSQVLDAIFKAAPFGMWLLDRKKEIVFVNKQMCDILGMSESQLLGRHHREIGRHWGPDNPAVFALDDPAVYLTDGAVENEQSCWQVDGNMRAYRIIRTRVTGDDGQVEGLLGLAVDTTDCKKAERLLRQEERRFRDIALSVGDLIWEVGPDWRFRYVSERASSILGYKADALIGKSLAELDNAAAAEAWQVLFRDWEENPKTFRNVEKWLQHKDGRRRCLMLSGLPIIEDDGSAGGFRGVAEDITERKQQEDNLKKALWEAEDGRDKIDSIIRSITDALVVIDDRQRVILLNPRAEALFGVTAAHAAGCLLGELCPDAEVQNVIMTLLENLTDGGGEACFAWPGGDSTSPDYFKARASRMRNIQGDGTGAIVIFHDVTQEREMERVKTEFISTAAHELRTPLTSIMGYLEFCMHPEEFGGFSDAQLKEFMTEIYDKAEVLERIVSDLLDISRMEAGREIPLVLETVDVAEISRKLLQHFQLQFPRYRFEMEFAAGTSHLVRADREKLVQVMENIISNAIKYSQEGKAVRVIGRCEPKCYRISVRDQGIGMTPEQIERMFDKFYRAVDLNSGVRGLGLGMHIVKHIIERHGGGIEVVSAPGAGTEIIFSLPLCE
ncbi:sensor histidine kinase, PAS, PAS and PAS domain-containing [Syntrophotalea carbinolica DSM 2380]|uniref:histidine kinase n=1 Tax=Syntrophotalea carbinolica (strain DSM 2380 / NBRC 103641 / GraBd1) TaxID=338963 RepID=Q3A207_SYNC1|nr:PAS domain S-box protein [Syntrophotalea carbinolica]ABA89600.1 sensor histidine kinase, PAS, PAS and PAS domain-containing [Syntrophotalea carbinolica DSM 2380]